MNKNILVAQSGGPSPVINSSLCGVINECRAAGDCFGKLYAAYRGIEGVLCEELIDLGVQSKEEIALLPVTPASGFIGSCRYKLKSEQREDFDRIIEVLKAHNIGYFFYIGGNDSMDTADKVAKLAKEKGYELIVVGIPKTIDNDLGDEARTIIDHTPGYGSCARYWAHLMQNANEENKAMCTSECVSVYQAMGRKSGFITAAARLGDPKREMPLKLYFAESNKNLESLAEDVNELLKIEGRCIVVVNEGFDVGDIGVRKDGFGHIEYGASGISASQAVVNYLNKHKLAARGQATGQLPGVIQRSVSQLASGQDMTEAYDVARYAVKMAVKGETGYMATILRKNNSVYEPYYDKVALDIVANSVRYLPKEWITDDGTDVTDAFIDYAMPLIGKNPPPTVYENGLQRFARLKKVFAEKKLNTYIPETLRV